MKPPVSLLTRFLSSWIILGLVLQPAVAEMKFDQTEPNLQGNHGIVRAEEYYSEEVQGEPLITVQVLGAVSKSGVYHVPRNTDVIRLLALCGGPRTEANLKDIKIKRRKNAKEETLSVNATELIEESKSRLPIVEAGDIVLVYAKTPWMDEQTRSTVMVFTSLLSVLASVLLISKTLK